MRCLELFAGAGGAALGIERAGFEHAALVERDPDACAVMRAAGLAPVVEADVRDLDTVERSIVLTESEAWQLAGDRLLDVNVPGEDVDPDAWPLAREALATRLLNQSGSIDLLWSSWPCQPWSHAGSRQGEHDDRNGWPWTLDAVDRFRPSWFLGENVRGLLSASYFVDVILPDLQRRYRHVGHWLLDAADYGVPQHRRRVFVWAGPAPLVPPTRTHGPGMFTRPWATMGQALQLDGARTIGGGRNPQAAGIERTYRDLTEPSTCVTAVQIGNAGPFVLHHMRNTDRHPNQERPTPSTEPAPAIGGRGNQFVDRPAPTVTTTEVKGTRASAKSGGTFNGGPDRASDALWLATGRRRLTPAECATLQGFPGGYPWHACRSKTARYRAIGNAVPPALAQAVAQTVLDACEQTPNLN